MFKKIKEQIEAFEWLQEWFNKKFQKKEIKMSANIWILLGVLALAFSAFVIPHGFNMKAQEKNKPAQKEAKPIRNQVKDSNIVGDAVAGNKSTQNIILQTNDTPESHPEPKDNPDKKQTNPKVAQIEALIKTNNGKKFVLLTKEFPDIQFFISGDINTHAPAYEIQILFEDSGIGFAASHMKELKAVFQPIIILGKELELKIISEQRKDELGIRLKTGYLSAQDRRRVFSDVASVVYELFYNLILIPKTERLKLEGFNKFKHYQIDNW